MKRFFKPPDFGSNELNITARLSYYLGAGFVVFSLIFLTTIQFFAPELTRRSTLISVFIIPVSVLIMILVRHGRLNLAVIILTTLIWLIVTISAITAGGVSAPILIGYILTIMVSGMASGRKTNLITVGICIMITIMIVIAEMNGMLPKHIKYSPVARASVYIFFFVLAGFLQSVNALNTRELLKKTRESEARYRSLLENIPATTYINSINADAATEYVSPQVEKLLGYPRNAFMDDPLFWTKILHPDDTILVQQESRKTAQTQETFNMEYRVIARDKRVIWLMDEAVLVNDENSKPLYWLGVWTDITKIKRLMCRLSAK